MDAELFRNGVHRSWVSGPSRDPLATTASNALGWRPQEQPFDLENVFGRELLGAVDEAIVMGDMSGLRRKDLKILWTVIIALVIDVMHHLSRQQSAAQFLFSDEDAPTDLAVVFVGAVMAMFDDQDVSALHSWHHQILPATECDRR